MPDTLSATLKSSLVEYLRSLRYVLETAQTYVESHDIDESVLLEMRLFPNMQPFKFQVQLATELAARGAARLAGQASLPDYPHQERSIADLLSRVDRAIADVSGCDEGAIADGLKAVQHVPLGGDPVPMTGISYVHKFLLPNFHFHLTTSYAMLRHIGVPLGKRDFMAAVSFDAG